MTKENLRKTGNRMEEAAADYLKSQGVRILERNFRSREAEIDIIGQQGQTLLFVEVKARGEEQKSGTAYEAVGISKQKKICRCAEYYMYMKGADPYRTSMRFDVIAITIGADCRISWIRNAFEYVPYSRSKPHWRVL